MIQPSEVTQLLKRLSASKLSTNFKISRTIDFNVNIDCFKSVFLVDMNQDDKY